MALLGQGFSDSRPTDAEYVHRLTGRQCATDLRELKDTIQRFFGVVMQVDNGLFQSNVVPDSSLIPLDPDPTGTGYREVSVNSKGRVISGIDDPLGEPKFRLRAFISSDLDFESKYETRDGTFVDIPAVTGDMIAGSAVAQAEDGYLPATAGILFYYRRFDFYVPPRVTELKWTIWQPYSVTYTKYGECRTGVARVTEGMQVRLILGIDSRTVTGALGSRIRINNISKDVGTTVPAGGATHVSGATDYFKSSFINYAPTRYNAFPRHLTPGYGFALLEWIEL